MINKKDQEIKRVKASNLIPDKVAEKYEELVLERLRENIKKIDQKNAALVQKLEPHKNNYYINLDNSSYL